VGPSTPKAQLPAWKRNQTLFLNYRNKLLQSKFHQIHTTHTWSSWGWRAFARASNAFAAWLFADDISPFGISSEVSNALLLSRSLPIVASVVTTLARVLRSVHSIQAQEMANVRDDWNIVVTFIILYSSRVYQKSLSSSIITKNFTLQHQTQTNWIYMILNLMLLKSCSTSCTTLGQDWILKALIISYRFFLIRMIVAL